MKSIEISQIEYQLPDKVVTNKMLKEENPDWQMDKVFERSGVMERHIAEVNETALDLAIRACRKLFVRVPEIQSQIDCIIFCTQSEDYIMPSNSFLIHKELDFSENMLAFDFNSACSGYVHGLALSKSLICSGQVKNVLLINADTYSKYIYPQDRSARVLFGDGAAVSWIAASSKEDIGIIDILCSTSGKNYDKFIIPAGGCRLPKSPITSREITNDSGNTRTAENIHMDGMGILTFVNSKVPIQIHELLKRNHLEIKDIDLFVFHQASKMVLDTLKKSLALDPQRVFSNLSQIGNTVSASLPIALADAIKQGHIKPNHKVLISGFGVGLSWATALLKF